MANEKRLIDAYKLENLVRSNSARYHHVDDIVAAIVGQPTVDAVEVVHGRWLSLEEYAQKIGANAEGYSGGWFFCSECEQQMRELHGWAFCPNCGAKMDGGAERAC